MEIRFKFNGTGGELFGKLFVGFLLTAITFGIYMPWFIVGFTRYLNEKTLIQGTPKGDVKLSFSGTGGDLFVKGIVGALLSGITLGIYSFWFMTTVTKFFTDHSVGTAADGTGYRLNYDGTGGQLFGKMFVGMLLTMITFGIYAPWFMCGLTTYFQEHTALIERDKEIGRFGFVGTGGSLFGRYLLGFILTMITFGIYAAWFQVDIMKFFASNSRVTVNGQSVGGEFTGTGGELFVIMLVGYLLTMVTLGIYGFWWMAKQIRFQTENTVLKPAAAIAKAA